MSRHQQDSAIATLQDQSIPSYAFFEEYHGHRVEHLSVLYPALRQYAEEVAAAAANQDGPRNSGLIWTAGDSSLDNKHWLLPFYQHSGLSPANPVYERLLSPSHLFVPDVTYWINRLLEERRAAAAAATAATKKDTSSRSASPPIAAINTSVEATTLNERTSRLRSQDVFLRDHIQSKDILIVSVGGNDVALFPTPCTILNMMNLVLCLPECCLARSCTCGGLPSCDDCCCGCGCSTVACCCSLCCCGISCPPCLGYFRHMFQVRLEHYIRKLTKKTTPKMILVCMIYYPDANPHAQSWAGLALGALGYNRTPSKLQTMIRQTFLKATSHIHIPNTVVVPVPLFQVLDGTDSDDYVARVEPSSQGGRKMAELFLDYIDRHTEHKPGTAPTAEHMEDRG